MYRLMKIKRGKLYVIHTAYSKPYLYHLFLFCFLSPSVSGLNGLGSSFEWSFHRLIFPCFFVVVEKCVSEVSFSCSHSGK
jgi:hypothetical protein